MSSAENRVSDSASDEILMAAYQAGNAAAFEKLFERHAGRVYGFLVRRLGDPALAEDLYQEAFLRVHRARHGYELGRPFRAWLFGIVHNLLTDALRQRRRSPEGRALEQIASVGSGNGGGSDPALLASSTPSPENAAATRETGRALSEALRALPSDEATVLILARLEGLSYDDIGRVIGRSAPATKQLAYRALKRIRAELASSGHPEEP